MRFAWKRVLFSMTALLALGVLTARAQTVESLQVGETRNVSRYGERVYFGGQPSKEDVKRFHKLGVRIFINLRTKEEMDSLDYDQAAALKEAGIRYLHVPMKSEKLPSDADLDKIFDALAQATAGQDTALLHCRSSGRVGAVWSAFRHVRGGLSLEQALAEGKKAGLRSERLREELKKRYGGQ